MAVACNSDAGASSKLESVSFTKIGTPQAHKMKTGNPKIARNSPIILVELRGSNP